MYSRILYGNFKRHVVFKMYHQQLMIMEMLLWGAMRMLNEAEKIFG